MPTLSNYRNLNGLRPGSGVWRRRGDAPRTRVFDRACTARWRIPAISAVADTAKETDRGNWIGRKIGYYEVLELVGAGGMGDVYRARNTNLPRSVAIKVLSPELSHTAARTRFKNEARIASSINHPHIVTVHEAGELEAVSTW